MTINTNSSRLVFSTEHGRTCPECEQPIEKCTCRDNSPFDGDGIIKVNLETKGRKGKGVTLLKGIPLNTGDLKKLAKELKQKCGVGGSVKNANIEIQGDHRDLLVNLLQQKGYTVKRSGG